MPPQPFKIEIPEPTISRILEKVAGYNWHEMPADGGWSYGTNLDYMKELCGYWLDEYDWRQNEAKLNRWDHFKSTVDGLDIHYIHEKGSGSDSLPLLISHGWPGSVYEFMDIIEPLTHPERFGGKTEDSFDVIAPSLPGFAFSGKPELPLGPRKIASIFSTLMQENLGYQKFLAQGGDWGSAISSWLGYEHTPACVGIHINMFSMRHSDGAQTQDEKEWEAEFSVIYEKEAAYNHLQSTKPQTLSYAMMDSPVGVAAWLVEKFNTWSDTSGDDIESVYTKDQLLTNIMIYLITGSFNTASWIYYGRRQEGGRNFPAGNKKVEVPVSAAVFPAEFLPWPPRSYADRVYNIAQWTDMPRGGHFAALEQPELLVSDIREFGRKFR
jgi:pimeloyl-ACP methyl ester carboxylesterase